MTPSLWSAILAAFLASLVELVEALTIVLAVGAVRGWRPALLGAGAALLLLAVLVGLFGPHLARLDVPVFKLAVGTLLLLFGLRWLRKAILRAAGVLALHDEDRAYARETAALRRVDGPQQGDFAGLVTAFNGVFIEGIEVVFIVLAVGAAGGPGHLVPAALGAAAAAVTVVALGVSARRPLTRIPENALKLAVGVLVSAFGTYWAGQGLRLDWPGGQWATLLLTLSYLSVAGLGVALARRVGAPEPARRTKMETQV